MEKTNYLNHQSLPALSVYTLPSLIYTAARNELLSKFYWWLLVQWLLFWPIRLLSKPRYWSWTATQFELIHSSVFPSAYPFYKANTSFFTFKVKMARKNCTEWRSAFYLFIFNNFTFSLSHTRTLTYNREAYPYTYTQCVKHTRIVICS